MRGYNTCLAREGSRAHTWAIIAATVGAIIAATGCGDHRGNDRPVYTPYNIPPIRRKFAISADIVLAAEIPPKKVRFIRTGISAEF